MTYSKLIQFIPGTCNQLVVNLWTLRDVCGNQRVVIQRVLVLDNIAPVISSCPAGITVNDPALVPPATPELVVATDNCIGALTYGVTTNRIPLASGCGYEVQYHYRVTDTCGNQAQCIQIHRVETSAAPPVFVQQPDDVAVTAGASATLTSFASGCAPLTYQWYQDGLLIPGAVAPNYITPALNRLDQGAQFVCIATSPSGVTESRIATVTILPPGTATVAVPVLTIQRMDEAHRSISLASELNVLYRLQWAKSLETADWRNEGPAQTGDGSSLTFTPGAAAIERRYYRVLAIPL